MSIEQTELRFKKDDEDVTASFTAYANVPARLQVWLHNEQDRGKVVAVDVRMFLRTLELRRDTVPVSFDDQMVSYLPGSKEVHAHLIDAPGWTWRFQTVKGRRVAVPVLTP